ncbi:NeuD/PglB/VioB family sugar acetyltransferase [Pseudoalteromonas sp. SSDWG2]|uniref:NeuD/PglB/VioB family sugar acetyltransferase n=1 Tax=Pseudoalteromonas sp. SSDWG2 TaxID=3139391 RepID=UPI003BAC89E9
MNNSRVIILGAGGHASVLADTIMRGTQDIAAVISPSKVHSPILTHLKHCSSDDQLKHFDPRTHEVVIGVGPRVHGDVRPQLVSFAQELGFKFAKVISEAAYVAEQVKIADGVQLLPACVVNTGAIIAEHVVVNSRALVEHDCSIGAFSHIGPAAVLCGGVNLGQHVFVGAGAVILPGVRIASHTIIGANALVDRDIDQPSTVYGARATVQQRSST